MEFEDLSSFELKRGNHERPEDGLCVLEAVAWFECGAHSDHPKCVCPVLAHFCRSFNDRLDQRRQELIPYIPRLANTAGAPDTPDTVQARLRLLADEFVALGGTADFARRLEARFARAPLPAHASSFGLAIVCDAVTIKRSASQSFELLDRLLAVGAPSRGFSTDVPLRARDLEELLTG